MHEVMKWCPTVETLWEQLSALTNDISIVAKVDYEIFRSSRASKKCQKVSKNGKRNELQGPSDACLAEGLCQQHLALASGASMII